MARVSLKGMSPASKHFQCEIRGLSKQGAEHASIWLFNCVFIWTMSFLNSILGSVLGGSGNDKTQMLAGLLGQVLSGTSSAPGAPSGVGGLVRQFEQAGLGSLIHSWVGTGANQTPTPGQVNQGMGPEMIGHFAEKLGIPPQEVSGILAQVLPHMVDHVTPDGTVPPPSSVQGMLGTLLGGLGK